MSDEMKSVPNFQAQGETADELHAKVHEILNSAMKDAEQSEHVSGLIICDCGKSWELP